MQRILAFFMALWLLAGQLQAQHIYITSGRIEFEKKVNVYALMGKEDDGEWLTLMKKSTPQFRTTYYDLIFNNDSLLYAPGREATGNGPAFMAMPAEENIVFSDLNKKEATTTKSIFDEKFLVKDSTRQIKWKITSETRTIAGFECRRANALIMDSVYVVAFYAESIIPPGGPESFNGLPGMILGVALPHEHVTWFATKVLVEEIKPAALKMPTKGKLVTNKSLFDQLQERFKSWGESAHRNIVASML